ncbi:hypothetical protein B0J11DRAFT_593512, partial [Dendryphion nanum]
MLSRASSDAGTRLRRSKSISTVHSYRPPVPDAVDPEFAQNQALAAATTAFIRAHAGEMAQKGSTDLGRTRSNTSRSSQGSHFPPRGSSFRSLQPEKNAQTPAISRPSRTSTMATEKFPSFHIAPSMNKTVSAQPPITFYENSRPSSQPSASTKSNRPGASSSVASQQIRKARSMYYASSIQTGSPIPRPPAKYLITPPSISSMPEGSQLSSLNGEVPFRRPRSSAVSPLASPRLPVTVLPGESVDMARDTYLKNFQHRQVKHRPSLFLAPFRKRQDKVKSRASSALSEPHRAHTLISYGSDKSLRDFNPPKEKRSFSNSLRHKFKKVFRKTSKETTVFPLQQAEASRDYFGDFATGTNQPPDMHPRPDIPSPDDDTLHRVRSRSPSLEGRRPALARPNSRGSNRSLHSETDIGLGTASRVTSWSNSSACGVLTQREIKRLTVIHEAKDSISSEPSHKVLHVSPGRKQPSQPGFSAFRDPMPMDPVVEEAATAIDPKRVFSALMKEIDGSNVQHIQPSTEADASRQVFDNESDIFVTNTQDGPSSANSNILRHRRSREYRPRTTSDEQRSLYYRRPDSSAKRSNASSVQANSFKASSISSFGRAIKSTIRAVTPSERKVTTEGDQYSSIRGAVRIPKRNSTGSSPLLSPDSPEPDMEDNAAGRTCLRIRSRDQVHRDFTPEQAITPTKEQIECRVQKAQSRWKTPLDEAESARFPRPMNRQFSLSNIAQRVFAQKTTRNESAIRPEIVSKNEDLSDPQQCPASPQSPRPATLMSPLSPSVYSRNTDGDSIFLNDSAMSLDATFDDDSTGSAIVIPSQAVSSYVIGTPTRQRVTHSARSSKDWRAWLSREVSELDYTPREDLTIQDQYITPIGHRRELTQITDEGSTLTGHEVTLPLLPLAQEPLPGLCTHQNQADSQVESASSEPSLDLISKLETVNITTARKLSPRPSSSMMPRTKRPSSIPSSSSSRSRPVSSLQTVERMNDRFPFIKSGRRSSSNSARLSRHTPSLAGSGSSSVKATPSPKVYSDFSVPASKQPLKYESNTRSRRIKAAETEKENRRENLTPSSANKTALPTPKTPLTLSRPKSLQLLSSSNFNRTQSSLTHYTRSAGRENIKHHKSSSTALTRALTRVQPSSPVKLSPRPKSAFDLRAANAPPLIPNAQVAHINSNLRRPALHMKTSSSTLAFSKEPSPGADDRHIDALLGHRRERYYVCERGTGSTSPGQRMADRFLIERSAGSGAGSPVSPVNISTDGPAKRKKLQREDTPAFL